MPSQELLSLEHAAHELGVDVRTLRRYIASGRLPAFRVGGARLIRVKRADLDALLVPIASAASR